MKNTKLHTALKNPVADAVKLLGGYRATGRICGVTGPSVRLWAEAGRLPRTEATGETNYAELMSKFHRGVNKQALLNTVYMKKR